MTDTPTVDDLLKHYSTKPVKQFVHVQGFVGADGVLHPDGDGHALTSSFTHELITIAEADAPVRIYIHEHARKDDVIALLRKAADWLERDWATVTIPEVQERSIQEILQRWRAENDESDTSDGDISDIPF